MAASMSVSYFHLGELAHVQIIITVIALQRTGIEEDIDH